MKNIPYFLLLIKRNVILWTIITTGGFKNVDLKGVSHDYWTSQYLQISNYSLSNDEKFNEIWITTTDISTTISFRTSSSKYLDNTRYYFDNDTSLINSALYYISDKKVLDVSKKLGEFDIGLNIPIKVTVGNSGINGYYIDLVLYKKGWIDKVKNMNN